MMEQREHCLGNLLAALFVLLLAAPALVAAGEWPQFRGPNQDGISGETGLLTSWPEAGPEQLWRVELGDGYSGLSVSGGRLFTMFGRGGSEYVAAFDTATGKELWRFRTDENYTSGQGDGPRSTPAVDGGVVYALGAQARLYALSAADGSKIWSRDLKADFGARLPQWGVSAAPLVRGDLLLLDAGGRPGNSLVALQKKTGETAWTAHTDVPGYSMPLPISVGGVEQVIFFTGRHVVSVDPVQGEVYWRLPWKTSYDVNAAAPIFIPPDKLFVSSGYDTGAALLRVKVAGGEVGVEEIWRSRSMKNQFSSSVIKDGIIYGFDNRTFKAMDLGTGQTLWRQSGLGHGSLLWADGHLIVLGERGRLVLAEATPEEYREKASTQLFTGKCWTVPTLAGGTLYARDEKELVALDVAGGEKAAGKAAAR